MNAEAALDQLNRLLPLRDRQQALPPPLRALHRRILQEFASTGRPPARSAIAAAAGIDDVDAALMRLAGDDLVVLSADRRELTGAYPFTLEPRVHTVQLAGHSVHAMCALDALSIAPMFGTRTRIDSRCHVTGAPVTIHMQSDMVLGSEPANPQVGIRWQGTAGCAAQSLCLEMVFLRDRDMALDWQRQAPASGSLFDLRHAIRLGKAFFCPLVA